MTNNNTITLNGKPVAIEDEKNLLEVIRKANIDLPTFCYHSELSVYGACRLCIVDIEGMGVVTSCSTKAVSGMVVRTHTEKLRKMRRIYLELLLANHHQTCTTCVKSSMCKLQDLASRMGVNQVRFKSRQSHKPIDCSNPSLVRDPNKCILCGDCVRACDEIQGIGAIDFANRGAATAVAPAFGKELKQVDCVYCGLCASVCPTGAITPKLEIEQVWSAISNPKKAVVAQIAPAVRVALGEMFDLEPGQVTTGKIAAALKMLGFDKVYDTSFAADLTVLEETEEFLARKTQGKKLPHITSCCPAWVKFAEQYLPDFLTNLSSCRSPQQMFGSLAKRTLPEQLKINAKDLFIVSIMPCTAKKFEARRPEFRTDDTPDIDAVLTTQELGQMIRQAGIQFKDLTPDSLDMPMGFKTGAGVIFGASGGVTEAALRYAAEKLTNIKNENAEFVEVRGLEGVRELTITLGDVLLKVAIVHGLQNARKLVEAVRSGEKQYDFIEVMACPGGCISGAGQPVAFTPKTRSMRAEGLYNADKTLQLHTSQDNPYLQKCYRETLGAVGGHTAHAWLHTKYKNRKRYEEAGFSVSDNGAPQKLQVNVCVGTSCYIRGSQKLLEKILDHVKATGLDESVEVRTSFCFEQCDRGPTVRIGQTVMNKCTFEQVRDELQNQTAAVKM